MSNPVRPWPLVGSRPLSDHRIFRLREDRRVSPRTGAAHDLIVLETPDWVNVIALTKEDQVVLIEQFRFAAQEVTLEIPGGMIDPGESPEAAARRELLEETGYEAESLVSLGSIAPNPAILDNRCHTFLLRGARRVAEPAQDEKEDIAVCERPLDEIPALLASGRISHALVAVAFQRLGFFQLGLLP